MNRKLGDEAFAFYASLGVERSYELVARRFNVARRTVAKAAKRENWAERTMEVDRKARQRLEQSAVDSLDDMNERHLKLAQMIQARAFEALKAIPLSSAMNAVRALNISIELERVMRGEPTDRQAVTVEEIVRREHARWLKPAPAATDTEQVEADEGEDEGDDFSAVHGKEV